MVLKQLVFWKFIFGVAIGTAIALTFYPDTLENGSELEYTSAVRAGIFAVCAALMLFLVNIPNSFAELKGAKLVDVFFGNYIEK